MYNFYKHFKDYYIGKTNGRTEKTQVQFLIDEDAYQKVRDFTWQVHPHMDGRLFICRRYKDVEGKWQLQSLSSALGYGKAYKHKNGDVFDFRKCNMVKKGAVEK